MLLSLASCHKSSRIFSETAAERTEERIELCRNALVARGTWVMEYFPATLTAEESADLLDRIRDEFSTEGFGPYAVERLSDGELLGFTGLHRVTFSGGLEGQVEILWRLRHDAWGQGYATEAARACIAHAAKLGIPELVAFTFVGNGRSRRVMQKLGMTCVGEFDHPALPEGHPLRRHALYRIRTEQ